MCNNGIRKFFGADFFFAAGSMINITGMNPILNGFEPGILNQIRRVELTQMHQHHDGAVEQT